MNDRYIHEHVHGPARPASKLLNDLLRLRSQYGEYLGISSDLACAGRDLGDRALHEASAPHVREELAS